jgi:hypothetical protein
MSSGRLRRSSEGSSLTPGPSQTPKDRARAAKTDREACRGLDRGCCFEHAPPVDAPPGQHRVGVAVAGLRKCCSTTPGSLPSFAPSMRTDRVGVYSAVMARAAVSWRQQASLARTCGAGVLQATGRRSPSRHRCACSGAGTLAGLRPRSPDRKRSPLAVFDEDASLRCHRRVVGAHVEVLTSRHCYPPQGSS